MDLHDSAVGRRVAAAWYLLLLPIKTISAYIIFPVLFLYWRRFVLVASEKSIYDDVIIASALFYFSPKMMKRAKIKILAVVRPQKN